MSQYFFSFSEEYKKYDGRFKPHLNATEHVRSVMYVKLVI